MAKLVDRLSNVEDQLEMFLWRFPDVGRDELKGRLKEFNKYDLQKRGMLDDHEALMLLESRGETKTAVELRQMVKDIDKDGDHMVSFIEWCCCVYQKPFEALNDFADEAARQAAMEQARAAGEAMRQAMAEIERAKLEEEQKAAIRAAALERESRLTGVAGAAAFFARKIESAGDATLTNEQKIKQEAARRRALREAKAKEKEAQEAASKQLSPEEVERQLQEARNKSAALEAAAAAAKAAEEKAARAARKAALNAKWGGGSAPATPGSAASSAPSSAAKPPAAAV